jgi:hypothetical protein
MRIYTIGNTENEAENFLSDLSLWGVRTRMNSVYMTDYIGLSLDFSVQPRELRLWSSVSGSTGNSLLIQCAQDIFTSFLRAAAKSEEFLRIEDEVELAQDS